MAGDDLTRLQAQLDKALSEARAAETACDTLLKEEAELANQHALEVAKLRENQSKATVPNSDDGILQHTRATRDLLLKEVADLKLQHAKELAELQAKHDEAMAAIQGKLRLMQSQLNDEAELEKEQQKELADLQAKHRAAKVQKAQDVTKAKEQAKHAAALLSKARSDWAVGEIVRRSVVAISDDADKVALHLVAEDAHNGTVFSRGSRPSAWLCPASIQYRGVACWDLNNDLLTIVPPSNQLVPFRLGKDYTHAAWVIWNKSSASFRTLLRNEQDHIILVEPRSNRLGMFSDNGLFRPCGHTITPDDQWHFVAVVGCGEDDRKYYGSTHFYVDGESVGTADRVSCGTKFFQFGFSEQGPGFVSTVLVWDRALTKEEIQAKYRETRVQHPSNS